jgi:hypothetical protein
MKPITSAFELAALHRRGRRLSKADVAILFNALETLYAALSKTKQRHLLPPAPAKRGRRRKYKFSEWQVGRSLDHELKSKKWSAAVAAMQSELELDGWEVPYGDDALRRCLKRYRERDARPYLRTPQK